MTDTETAARFAALGFAVEHTGGNCSAYVRRHDDVVDVVTAESDPTIPESLDERICWCTYGAADWDGGDEPADTVTATARNFLAMYPMLVAAGTEDE